MKAHRCETTWIASDKSSFGGSIHLTTQPTNRIDTAVSTAKKKPSVRIRANPNSSGNIPYSPPFSFDLFLLTYFGALDRKVWTSGANRHHRRTNCQEQPKSGLPATAWAVVFIVALLLDQSNWFQCANHGQGAKLLKNRLISGHLSFWTDVDNWHSTTPFEYECEPSF